VLKKWHCSGNCNGIILKKLDKDCGFEKVKSQSEKSLVVFSRTVEANEAVIVCFGFYCGVLYRSIRIVHGF
jgi:hypothetical protein